MDLDLIYDKMNQFSAKIQVLFDRLDKFEKQVSDNNSLLLTTLEDNSSQNIDIAVLKTRFEIITEISKTFKDSFTEIATVGKEIQILLKQNIEQRSVHDSKIEEIYKSIEKSQEELLAMANSIKSVIDTGFGNDSEEEEVASIREMLYEVTNRKENGKKKNWWIKGWDKAIEQFGVLLWYIVLILTVSIVYKFIAEPIWDRVGEIIKPTIQQQQSPPNEDTTSKKEKAP